MKYLLQAIESRPGRVGLTDHELKQLLSDVKDGRETKGSDEWYESLEKVVQELRSTPEAHWFLKPVSKKDVKDYYTIVTHPMDLGTVLKKTKNHVYKSKAEFKADIDLIWDNCLLYNTSPTHPIRHNAIHMKRKADHHLDFLVDAAASHEDPLALLDAKDEDEEESDEERLADGIKLSGGNEGAKRSKDGQGGSSSRKISRTATVPITPCSPPISFRPIPHRTPSSMAKFAELDSSSHPIAGPSRTPIQRRLEAQKDSAPSSSSTTIGGEGPREEEENDVEEDRWWKMVGKDEMMRSGVPGVTPMVQQDFHRRTKKGIGSYKGKERASAPTKPQPPPPPIVLSASPSTKSRPLSDPSSSKFSSGSFSSNSFPNKIHHNIATLQSLRKAHHKLSSPYATGSAPSSSTFSTAQPSKNSYPPQMIFGEADVDESESEREDRMAREEVDRRLGGGEGGSEMGDLEGEGSGWGEGSVGMGESLDGLKRVAGTVLAHAGFEAGSEGALNTLTSVLSSHLSKLGRTMRMYLDTQAKQQLSAEEIVLHTLFENGTKKISELEAYILDDVEQYGQKVEVLKGKMEETFLKAVDIEPTGLSEEALFANDGEMLISNFLDDLGEDYFGFRVSGLDKDVGVKIISVPPHLLYGRPNPASLPPPPPPPPPPPLASPLSAAIPSRTASSTDESSGLVDKRAPTTTTTEGDGEGGDADVEEMVKPEKGKEVLPPAKKGAKKDKVSSRKGSLSTSNTNNPTPSTSTSTSTPQSTTNLSPATRSRSRSSPSSSHSSSSSLSPVPTPHESASNLPLFPNSKPLPPSSRTNGTHGGRSVSTKRKASPEDVEVVEEGGKKDEGGGKPPAKKKAKAKEINGKAGKAG